VIHTLRFFFQGKDLGMQETHTNALSALLSKHIGLTGTRLETMSWLVAQMVRLGTVSLWRLAAHMESRAQTRSVHRRLERFFQFVRLDGGGVARLIVAAMGLSGKPWRLVLDRTNWKFGQSEHNILMLGVLLEGVCVPLFWTMLDKTGNTNAEERIDLLQRLRDCFPGQKLSCVIGDREFVGERWMSWLHAANIPFVLRVKENMHIWNAQQNAPVQMSRLFASLRKRKKILLKGVWHLGAEKSRPGPPVRIAAMRLKTGDLLIVATTARIKSALPLYRQRWGIETLFSCLKTRGMNLEATHMTHPEKISVLLAVVSVGFCCAYKTGIALTSRRGPQRKSHGRKERSAFALGLNALRKTTTAQPFRRVSALFADILSRSTPLKPLIQAGLRL
jgi:hypothetical protein